MRLGLNKAKKILGLEAESIAVVGDQIFTDVLGANRSKMISILVDPVEEKDLFITGIKRPIEKVIKNSYLRRKEDVH